MLFAEMQPDFAVHSLEMRCKGSTFFGTHKTFGHFFIKILKKSRIVRANTRIKTYLCSMEETKKLVETIIQGIQEKKGHGIVVADLTGINGSICHYFIICEGQSPTQVDAITDSISDMVREQLDEKPVHVVGRENAQWVAMDYTDVMAHIFLPDVREYYDLEHLWDDAKLSHIPDMD